MSQSNPESMKIGYLFDGCFQPNEGVPSYIKDVGEYMEAQGHEAVYLVGKSVTEEPSIIEIGRTARFGINGNEVEVALPITAKRAKAVLEIADVDILHVQMPHNPFVSGRIAKRSGVDVPVVGTFHVLPNSPTVTFAMHAMAKATNGFNRSLSAMISNSTATKQFVEDVYGVDSILIPCPVDLDRFQAGRRLEKYDDGKLNVVFLGRLVERKGAQHLISAMAKLSDEQRGKVRLLIAGKGELDWDLREAVVVSRLAKNTEFLGFVEEEDKPDILASADLAVFPATGGESFGIVLAEAMAAKAGVVIGGDNPGYRSVLSDTPEAIVDPTDVDQFATLLAMLIDDEGERKRIHSAQQQAVKQFDIKVVGPAIESVYRGAVIG